MTKVFEAGWPRPERGGDGSGGDTVACAWMAMGKGAGLALVRRGDVDIVE